MVNFLEMDLTHCLVIFSVYNLLMCLPVFLYFILSVFLRESSVCLAWSMELLFMFVGSTYG